MSTQTNGHSNGHTPTFDIHGPTMRGDLRDRMLQLVKELPKPWAKMSETEQRRIIDKVEQMAKGLVAESIAVAAAKDRPHLVCRVSKLALDDKGAKLTIEGIPSHDGAAIDATRLQGRRIVLALASIDAYQGERAPATPEPDQRRLINDEVKEEAHA